MISAISGATTSASRALRSRNSATFSLTGPWIVRW